MRTRSLIEMTKAATYFDHTGPIRSDQMMRSGQNRDQIEQAIRPSSIEFRTKPTKAWSERWSRKFDQEKRSVQKEIMIRKVDQQMWSRNSINNFDQEIWSRNSIKKFDQESRSGISIKIFDQSRILIEPRSNLDQFLADLWSNFRRNMIEFPSKLWWNLKQFRSSGHPKSTRSRSWDPPGGSQGAQVVPGDGLERPRHDPGVSRKRPWSVRWAPNGAILKIGVRKNAGTKILIAVWASWTTNDTNFASIFEQIWSIFRS